MFRSPPCKPFDYDLAISMQGGEYAWTWSRPLCHQSICWILHRRWMPVEQTWRQCRPHLHGYHVILQFEEMSVQ